MEYSKDVNSNDLFKSNKNCLEEPEAARHFQEIAKREWEIRVTVTIKGRSNAFKRLSENAKSRFLSVERRHTAG